MSRPVARVYPNGEFSLWWESESVDISDAPEPDPLGLSTLPNSHKEMLGLPIPAPRQRQGMNGISSHGSKMVRNACYLLQRTHGRENLSFVTLTLPPLPNHGVISPPQWAEITRQVVQTFRRRLVAHGLPGSIVGVVEIQMERQKKEGGMPLHLHIVFKGRKGRYSGWAIAPHEVDIVWLRACLNAEPRFQGVSFKSACRIERIEKDAAGYMGKYLSKGKTAVQAVLEACPEASAYLPSSWWICSNKLKAAINVRVRYGEGPARRIMSWARADDPFFDYWRDVWIELGGNPKAMHCVVGKLTVPGIVRMGLRANGSGVLKNGEE